MLIDCQKASFGYEGKVVVRELYFNVEPSDYLWVVGENGSGKTTLILGILRLLNPMAGRITFCAELARGGIGYLSQQSVLKKDFPAGVHEVVLSGNLNSMGLRPFYSGREKARAEEAMERLGIKDLGKKCFRELSGGQQRRVLLARAFCAAQVDPTKQSDTSNVSNSSRRLLVLDEPAAGLDPLITVEVYELLKTLNQDTGISIIMVSHDTRGARQYSNKILHMENGQGFFDNAAEHLRSDRGIKFFGHGTTETGEKQ
jgi:zinc transport system ATP-binding protein